MKKLIIFICGLFILAFAGGAAAASQDPDALQIDRLVAENFKKHGIKPNPPVSDEVFARRVYLDIIGRIPTKAELDAYLGAKSSSKRSKLIDYLLDSEGYVSHSFNFWADILRVKSRMQGEAGVAYADWVKDTLRKNTPYDEMVRELITADGYVWDNPAVGFYIRDAGMPLDHMSNTVQIFLGTQLVCAQCHNHPFDKWKQKDYYQMAAFTYGVDTRIRPETVVEGLDKEMDKIDRRSKRSRSEKRKGIDQSLRRALNDILQPLSYGVRNTNKVLKLPHDYQYPDADPKSPVEPNVMFGEKVRTTKDLRAAYAKWMTDTDNPRFSKVIANRLWKRAFGRGLIEPVDDFKDDTDASNPALMDFLAKQMVRQRFDLKKFQRMIYNTRTYQRAATAVEVPAGTPYHYPGPMLRRMTAEQLWDSVLTVAVPDIDKRTVSDRYDRRKDEMKARAEALLKKGPKNILALARKIADVEREYDDEAKVLRSSIARARASENKVELQTLNNDLRKIDKVRKEKLAAIRKEEAARDKMMMATGSDMMMKMEMKLKVREEMPVKDPGKKGKKGKTAAKKPIDPWHGYPRDFVRASEVQSPAPTSHFLRRFGQSDRETIENSENDASVSQVLSLLNGPVAGQITAGNSVLKQAVKSASTEAEKQDAIFMTLVNRKPNDLERELVAKQFATYGEEKAVKNVVWALLNGREFAFIQ